VYNGFVRILKNSLPLILLLGLIIALYFVFRLPNLTYQPIFADEAIYIRWAQIMKSEPTLRFLPLSDGKTPLFMWTMMPVFKIIEDPLLAGRLLAVFSGIATLLGVFILGLAFFNKRVALFSAFLVATTPYVVFFDRMALVDTMLASFVIWSILTSLLLVRFPRIDLAMFLGYLLGGGLLTKTPGMFNVVTVPLAMLTLNFSPKGRIGRVLKSAGLFVIAIAVGMGIYNILRLGPGFTNLNSRNQDYVRNPLDLLNNPLDPLLPHLGDVVEWWSLFFGYPLVAAIFAGVVFAFLKKNKYILTILVMALVPMLIQMALLRTFTARYLLFSVAPLLVVAAFGIDNILTSIKRFKKTAVVAVVLLLLVWPVYFANKLFYDIENAPLPKNERRGYLEDWTSGYGLREIAEFLEGESKKGLIIVGTEGSFGTLPDGLSIYFDKNRQVVFKPGNSSLSEELRAEATKSATFYVANKSRFPEYTESVETLAVYEKAQPKDSKYKRDAMLLLKVYPRPEDQN
jgi:4-amino-4-deoxy-L-arabinose transferase-like glycosyltransferase